MTMRGELDLLRAADSPFLFINLLDAFRGSGMAGGAYVPQRGWQLCGIRLIG